MADEMTREEALQILDTIPTIGEQVDALEMAIKALEQEPCERFEWGIDGNVYKITKAKDGKEICQQVCNDAISRQAVLDTISELNAISFYEAQEDSKECYYEIRQAVENMPPVTPQQKYGKWIEHPEIETSASEYLMFYECSECGNKPCFCKSDIHKKRFCSNCGAKMQESEEI